MPLLFFLQIPAVDSFVTLLIVDWLVYSRLFEPFGISSFHFFMRHPGRLVPNFALTN